jgi:putative DNA primase/helicase
MSAFSAMDDTFCVQAVSEVTAQSVAWLWAQRLALGKLAILDGDPGLGKSLLALDLCARLSTGRPFPDGSVGPGPGNALVLNAEDGVADTLRPRLETLGADLSRVAVVGRRGEGGCALLRLPAQLGVLDAALARTQARLLVLDPIVALLDPGILSASDQSVRQALAPLAALAERHACAVLLIRHLNKSGDAHSVYRGGGSIGFVSACRSAWLVARDPQEPARCVLAQVKNNLAPPQPSLAYTVQGQLAGPPQLSWLGLSPWNADRLLGEGARPPAAMTPRDRARAFLAGLLETGPQTSRDIWTAAQKEGLTERTLERAKRELEVRSVRAWAKGQRLSYWLLPSQRLPDTVTPDPMDEALEIMRQLNPPPTPLDKM